jgi:hypothetical protein
MTFVQFFFVYVVELGSDGCTQLTIFKILFFFREEISKDTNCPTFSEMNHMSFSEFCLSTTWSYSLSRNACPVKEEVVAPFWANNTRGEVLALLNRVERWI